MLGATKKANHYCTGLLLCVRELDKFRLSFQLVFRQIFASSGQENPDRLDCTAAPLYCKSLSLQDTRYSRPNLFEHLNLGQELGLGGNLLSFLSTQTDTPLLELLDLDKLFLQQLDALPCFLWPSTCRSAQAFSSMP